MPASLDVAVSIESQTVDKVAVGTGGQHRG